MPIWDRTEIKHHLNNINVNVVLKCSVIGCQLLQTLAKLEYHPLSAVHDCLFNLFAATLHIGGCSSIRNLKTRHAVVTGTHYTCFFVGHPWEFIVTKDDCTWTVCHAVAGGTDGPGEESQGSAISTATTESMKKKGRMEVGDSER